MAESFFKFFKQLKYNKAVLNILVGNALIGIGPFFVEFSGLDAMNTCFYRMIAGSVAFFIISFMKQESYSGKRFAWLYIAAALMITVDLLLYNQSILYIGSGLSTVLSHLEVFFLILLGALI